VFRNDPPHGGTTQALANTLVKARAPDRIVSPGIAACHRYRAASWLQTPFGSAHEAARRVRLVELERVEMLSPHSARALQVLVEEAHHRAEGVHHQAPADQTGRVRQAVGVAAGGRK